MKTSRRPEPPGHSERVVAQNELGYLYNSINLSV